MHIEIDTVNNGLVYEIGGSIKHNGEFICKATEEFDMLERIGEALLGFKIKVERR